MHCAYSAVTTCTAPKAQHHSTITMWQHVDTPSIILFTPFPPEGWGKTGLPQDVHNSHSSALSQTLKTNPCFRASVGHLQRSKRNCFHQCTTVTCSLATSARWDMAKGGGENHFSAFNARWACLALYLGSGRHFCLRSGWQ